MEFDHYSKRTYIILSLAIAPFLTNFIVAAINIALPSMALDLNMDAVELGWIPTAYLIALTMFLIPAGKLGDIYGRKKLFNIGLIIFSIGSLLAIFAYTNKVMILSRVLQGIGSALIFSNLYAIIASLFVHHDRVRALSLIFGVIFLGSVLGPIIGGFLTFEFGWRSIFELCTVVGIIGSILISRMDVEWFASRGEKFDLWGSIIFCISALCVIYGFSRINQGLNFIFIILGLTGLLVFFRYEKLISNPIFNLELLCNKGFILNNMATLLEFAPSVPIVFILSIYLQDVRGTIPYIAGLILVLQPITMLIVSIFTGKLDNLIKPRNMVIIAFLVNIISTLIFLTIAETTPILVIMLGLIISGVGSSLFASPNSHLVMSSVGEKHYGTASATITTMRGFGGTVGMSIVLLILTLFLGNADIAPFDCKTFITSSQIIFLTMGIVYLIGILVAVKNGIK